MSKTRKSPARHGYPGVAERIRRQLGDLTPAEHRLADALMANYPVAGLASITELARQADVSTPTVVRTVRKLGFSGFSSFQAALRNELEATLSDPISRRQLWVGDAPAEHLLNRFADRSIANLRQTLKLIDHKAFDQIAAMIGDDARAVHVVGGRISHAVADYLATHLQIVRPGVELFPASASLWPHNVMNMKPGDVLIMFDMRRYETNLTQLAELAGERGVELVLFTDRWMSPAARHARHVLAVHSQVPSGWDSSLVSVFLAETLVAAVGELSWEETERRIIELEALYDATGRFKKPE